MNLRQQFKRIGERPQSPKPYKPIEQSNDVYRSIALDDIAPLDMSFDELVEWYDQILPRVKVMIDIGGMQYGQSFIDEAWERVHKLTENGI